MSSLQEFVAAKRAALQQERSFVLPVTGYEERLAARYRALGYEESWDLLHRYTGEEESAENDLISNAELLIEACVELLEVTAPDEYQSLGCKWSSSPSVLRDKLGLDLVDGATARDALLALFDGPEGGSLLSEHAMALGAMLRSRQAEVDKEMAEGEPRPAQAGL